MFELTNIVIHNNLHVSNILIYMIMPIHYKQKYYKFKHHNKTLNIDIVYYQLAIQSMINIKILQLKRTTITYETINISPSYTAQAMRYSKNLLKTS